MTISSVFGLSAEAWSAIGVWVTLGVYLALAGVGVAQLREARRTRREQSRAYMIAKMNARKEHVRITFENIGSTEAKDVRVELAQEFERSSGESHWRTSPLFASGLRNWAPAMELTFELDHYMGRKVSSLPMSISGVIHYRDIYGVTHHDDFEVDFEAFGYAIQKSRSIDDVVKELAKIGRSLERWADADADLRVRLDDSVARGSVDTLGPNVAQQDMSHRQALVRSALAAVRRAWRSAPGTSI